MGRVYTVLLSHDRYSHMVESVTVVKVAERDVAGAKSVHKDMRESFIQNSILVRSQVDNS